MRSGRSILAWAVLAVVIAVPIVLAMTSPLLAWRRPVYIVAGFAGVFALALLLLQPLLIGGYVAGLSPQHRRRVHRWTGVALVGAIMVHVGGLWITSPPDVVDALLFVSPTPFSAWGVVGMWAIFATALLVSLRHRLGLRPRLWRAAHAGLAVVIVVASAVHALLIEGTMETVSKAVSCLLVVAATVKVLVDLRVWSRGPNPR